MSVTRRAIRSVLQETGLAGQPVCLHSSLRSFGSVAGGAASVIGAFLDEHCTVLVPTFSWNYAVSPPASQRPGRNGWEYEPSPGPTDGAGRIYTPAVLELDGDMGAVPAAVVASPDHRRGDHPLNSFSAIGPLAQALVGGQAPLDVYAPLRALAQWNGFVLLMGVGLDKMTLLHLAEKEAGRTLFRRWANDGHGRPQAVEVGGCSDGFGNFAPVLQPIMTSRRVGPSVWSVFLAPEALRRAAAAIQSRPAVTHCGAPACGRCHDAVAGGPVLPHAKEA